MKLVNFKKIFCIMLSVGVLVSGARGESSNVKKIAKAAAPYVGFGVPTGALLIGGAVLLAKLLPRGEAKPDGEPEPYPPPEAGRFNTLIINADSTHIVGDSAVQAREAQGAKAINDAIAHGKIPGITFYRYAHNGPTYHCYIIDNYEEAEEFLKRMCINDMKNWLDHWEDVKLFQNRWLSKEPFFDKIPKWMLLKKGKWSFKEIFGFEKGFGYLFDQITSKIENHSQRDGTVDLNHPPEEFQNFAAKLETPEFGKTVFDDSSGITFNVDEDFDLKRCIMSKYNDPEQLRNDYSASKN